LIYNTSATLCQALTGLILPIHALDGRNFNVAIVHIIHPGYEKIIPNEGMPIYSEGGKLLLLLFLLNQTIKNVNFAM
jgi:DnaJ family protein B protein 4